MHLLASLSVRLLLLCALQGRVSFDQTGARIPSAAKVFKYFGANSSRSSCGRTPGRQLGPYGALLSSLSVDSSVYV